LSFDAIRWALAQPVAKSPAKFILVAMANCVDGDGPDMRCWPSVQHLADATSQDRKTVMDGLRRLREAGFIKDTGERRGATGQVAVYLLKSPESGTAAVAPTPAPLPAPAPSNSTKNGTSTESGTVPDFPRNSTESPIKESRISLVTVPKTGHGTSKEPLKEPVKRKKADAFDPSGMELPDWLPAESWGMWCRDRAKRGKPMTEDAARMQVKKLDGYRAQGFTAAEVIEHSVGSSYQGLYPPSRAQQSAAAPQRRFEPRHAAAGRTIFGPSNETEVIDVEAR
jgi:hypothetical protein